MIDLSVKNRDIDMMKYILSNDNSINESLMSIN
jgi:hypothetical protein